MIKKLVLLAAFSFCSVYAYAQQTTIRVVGMYSTDADIGAATAKLSNIASSYASSGLPGGVSIDIANLGIPIPITVGPLPGNDVNVMKTAAMSRNVPSVRNYFGADLVVIFVDDLTDNGMSACGLGIQENWIGTFGGTFVGDSNGLDLRGSEDYFIAWVATDAADCLSWNTLATHEVGHLMGGGHQISGPWGEGLDGDSHAGVKTWPPMRGITTTRVTAIANVSAFPGNCGTSGVNCVRDSRYSSGVFQSSARNVGAFSQTAQSVASYRTPPTGCGLTTPVAVHGYLRDECIQGEVYTTHDVYWTDLCPTETSKYEVWYQQPAYSGNYIYGWDRYSADTGLIVQGSDSNIKALACSNSAGFCTGLSFTFYTATWTPPELCQ